MGQTASPPPCRAPVGCPSFPAATLWVPHPRRVLVFAARVGAKEAGSRILPRRQCEGAPGLDFETWERRLFVLALSRGDSPGAPPRRGISFPARLRVEEARSRISSRFATSGTSNGKGPSGISRKALSLPQPSLFRSRGLVAGNAVVGDEQVAYDRQNEGMLNAHVVGEQAEERRNGRAAHVADGDHAGALRGQRS